MDDETAILLAIETLRSNPEYHAAEVLRRKTVGGSAAMAANAANSSEKTVFFITSSSSGRGATAPGRAPDMLRHAALAAPLLLTCFFLGRMRIEVRRCLRS